MALIIPVHWARHLGNMEGEGEIEKERQYIMHKVAQTSVYYM